MTLRLSGRREEEGMLVAGIAPFVCRRPDSALRPVAA
jgi:hypothetical protein